MAHADRLTGAPDDATGRRAILAGITGAAIRLAGCGRARTWRAPACRYWPAAGLASPDRPGIRPACAGFAAELAHGGRPGIWPAARARFAAELAGADRSRTWPAFDGRL